MTDMTNWNADDWHLLLSQYLDSRATHPNGLNTVALLIADSMDALRAPAATPLTVRPLEWEEGKGELDGQLVWSAGEPWLFWIVKNTDSPKYVWCENFNIEGFFPCSPVRGSFDTLDEAKAAAQEDYTKRILGALVSPCFDNTEVQAAAAEAIRTFCRSLGAASVQNLYGVERIYYSGINLNALAAAVALAVSRPHGGSK